MRKMIVSTYMSLDGVIENPMWTFKYWNDDLAKFQHDDLFAADTLLLGRETYQGFFGSWPQRTGADAFADRINGMAKVVASRTLQSVEWNATLLGEDVAQDIARLKQQPGQNILKYGGGELLRTLIQHNLLDELHLLVFPVFLGSGARLVPQGDMPALKLVENRRLGADVVALIYQPASDTTAATA